ncbi:hypothetical protein [Eubacterium pyruvativorans]|uniref:hypothetical protein n=1 Tax=Eubacterium pyruvativorans TaxID=155865 RepID=UPI0015682C4E|nr:hypothetical protein [Eubacterium pyruvativorans]
MNYSRGFSASYHMTILDPVTFRDVQTVSIKGGSIDRSTSELMESADIDLTEIPGDGEAWIRVYLTAQQEGAEEERIPVFTGLLSVPERSINGRRESYSAECYSVLKPASDILLRRGWYAPSDVNGAELAASLLSCGPAPIIVSEHAPALSGSIVSEDGETNLSMAEKILSAIGWRIRITGAGQIQICEPATEPIAVFDALEKDSIEMQVTDTRDWFSCPNVFRAVQGDLVSIARDDDPGSSLSTVSRGREIWMEETDCSLGAGENLSDYALRRLKEEQSPARKLKYDRRYQPDIVPGDLVRIQYPGNSIDGIFQITSQSIELGYNAKTTEEAVMV